MAASCGYTGPQGLGMTTNGFPISLCAAKVVALWSGRIDGVDHIPKVHATGAPDGIEVVSFRPSAEGGKFA